MDNPNTPLVSIVVLNWNGITDTLQCLDSLKDLEYKNTEIIVIDNGSNDSSIEQLRARDEIILIELPKNTGFTGGHIKGMLRSEGDYIALLNNDLVVHPEWLSRLVDTALSQGVDIVGGKSFSWNSEQRPFDITNTYSSYQTVNPVTAHTITLHSDSKITEVNNLSGSNLLVSRRCINKIGYLENSFFAYYEETDLIARAKRAGFKAVYDPEAMVWHKIGASSADKPFFFYYQMHRNRYRFAVRNYDSKYLRKFMMFYFSEFVRSYRNNMRNPNDHDKAMVRAFIRNFFYLPMNLGARKKIQKLGESYVEKILAPTEGYDDITVIVPCYNYGGYVREALDSLESQVLKPNTVIIINDGSTDDSASVIRSYITEKESSGTQIHYLFIDKKNEGVVATKNLALKLVSTTWMLFLDADDILSADYIYRCIRTARENNSDVVYTDMLMFGATEVIQKTAKFNKRLLRSVNFVHNSSLMKTDLFKSVGGYKERMSVGFEDWELYLSFTEKTLKFSYIPEPLFLYRRHEGASRDIVAQTKLPMIIKVIEELHPQLYGLRYYLWLESYRAWEHAKEIIKFPYRLMKHSYHHTIITAKKSPERIRSKIILSARNKMKG